MKLYIGQFCVEFTPEDVGWFSVLIPKRISYFLNRKIISKKCYFLLKEYLENDISKNNHVRFSQNRTYQKNKEIILFLENLYPFIKKRIKNIFIKDYVIDNYNQNDIFVAAMILLGTYLTTKDVSDIYFREEGSGNNPQFSKIYFLEQIQKELPKLQVSKHVMDDFQKANTDLENWKNS